jgi:hypothetical protein
LAVLFEWYLISWSPAFDSLDLEKLGNYNGFHTSIQDLAPFRFILFEWYLMSWPSVFDDLGLEKLGKYNLGDQPAKVVCSLLEVLNDIVGDSEI